MTRAPGWSAPAGHDLDVMDKLSNENGGMLVITTSVPDTREWIQWKGRTARQDRPGQVRQRSMSGMVTQASTLGRVGL